MGMPVEKAVKRQLVSLMSGKNIAAYGVLADQPPMVSVLVGDTTKELKLTSKRAALSIQKILLNGLIIKAQKLSLEQLGPPCFSVVVPLKYLCTRKEEEPQEISITPAALRLPPNIPLPKPAKQVLAQTSQQRGLDHYNDDSSDGSNELEYMSFPPESVSVPQGTLIEIDSDDEYDTAESRAECAARLFIDMSKNTQPNVQIFNPGYVQQEYSKDRPLYTNVFDDIFHVQLRLLKLLPKAHSAFNEFSRQLSQVMLVEDAGDEELKQSWLQIIILGTI